MAVPAFLIPLLPYVFKTVIGTIGVIAVDIFRRKANVEKLERKILTGKAALDRIDQLIIGTVGAMYTYKKEHNLDGKETFQTAKQIVNNSITKELKKEALKAVENLDAYILRGIENAVLEIKLKKKGGEK